MLKQDAAPPVVQKTYEFVLWLVKKVESFPKAHRFTVGERLTAHSLDLLTTLVEAAYTRNKEKQLEEASRKVNARAISCASRRTFGSCPLIPTDSASSTSMRSVAWSAAGARPRRRYETRG